MLAPPKPSFEILRDADPTLYPCSTYLCRQQSVMVTASVNTGAINGACVTHALHLLHPERLA